MKRIFVTLSATLLLAASALAQDVSNMSDSLDKNIVPANQEARKKVEKPTNLSDSVDRNYVPAPFEERQKEEESVFSSGKKNKTQDKKQDQHSGH